MGAALYSTGEAEPLLMKALGKADESALLLCSGIGVLAQVLTPAIYDRALHKPSPFGDT